MVIWIMPYSIPTQVIQRFGICPGERLLVLLLGRSFPVAGYWRLQLTLTAMAIQTTRFTGPALDKRGSGISITTFTSAPRSVLIFHPAGAWSGSEVTSLASWFRRCLVHVLGSEPGT